VPHLRQVRPRAVLAAAALVGMLGLGACSSSEPAAGNDQPNATTHQNPGFSAHSVSERKAAPKLEGTTLTGAPFALTDHKGKVVVVNFWGSWCGPCRGEAPALAQVAKATGTKGVMFVGVDERDTKAAARSFQKTFQVTYPSVFDDDGSIAALWPPAAGPPYTFIIDKQGRVAARFVGGVTADELQTEVLKVASEA
jgi:thiol-disulfide isomerase/thioredoxin